VKIVPFDVRAPDRQLVEYLAEREVACPLCRNDLRGLAQDSCPVCKQSLLLRVDTAGRGFSSFNDASLLKEYLADRDVPCPICGYSLRGLQRADCPECAHQLLLGIGLAQEGPTAYAFAMAPLGIGLVIEGLVLLASARFGRAFDELDPQVIFEVASVVFYAGAMGTLAVRRRRFLQLPSVEKWSIVILCWMSSLTPWALARFM
jgi:hypothetical protein